MFVWDRGGKKGEVPGKKKLMLTTNYYSYTIKLSGGMLYLSWTPDRKTMVHPNYLAPNTLNFYNSFLVSEKIRPSMV